MLFLSCMWQKTYPQQLCFCRVVKLGEQHGTHQSLMHSSASVKEIPAFVRPWMV